MYAPKTHNCIRNIDAIIRIKRISLRAALYELSLLRYFENLRYKPRSECTVILAICACTTTNTCLQLW